MGRLLKFLMLAVLLGASVSCSGEKKKVKKLSVYVSISPQVWIVKNIGGDFVKTRVLVKPGEEPHTFSPSARAIMNIGRSDLYLTIGLPLEKKITEKLSDSKKLRFVNMASGIKYRSMKGGHECHDCHEDGKHKHSEQGQDPHVWLSTVNLRIMAQNTYKALSEKLPARSDYFKKKLEEALSKIDEADKKVRKVLTPFKGQKFFVFHPAFGYFGDEYGLIQEAVEIEGKSPSPRQLSSLIKEAKKDKVKILFAQPGFSPRSAKFIAEAIGGAVVTLDPLAEDVPENLQIMAAKLEEALKKQVP